MDMAIFSVTQALVGFVNDLAIGDGCSTQPPMDSQRFQTVENLGGPIESKVCSTSIAIQAWAADEAQAEADANAIAYAVETSNPPAGVHSMHVTQTPYPWWDDSTRLPRYQLTVDVTHQLIV